MSGRRDVIVIGGGQAGLAMGWHLARSGADFAILDAAAEVGGAWRARWESLGLFTPARYSALPGLRFPAPDEHLPTKDEVADYLAAYARRFALPVHSDEAVHTVRPLVGGGFIVGTSQGSWEAEQVVLATGAFQRARLPSFARDLACMSLHSSEYRNPAQLPDGPVVVVGGGNSGVQIAEELAATRETSLALGARLPRLPERVLGKSLFWWLDRTGLMEVTVESSLGRRLQRREALVGNTPAMLAHHAGVRLLGRITGARGDTLCTADGSTVKAAAVVWATGFRPDYHFLHAPVLGPNGAPVHHRGVTAVPGLYFLGLPWQHTRGSALLGGVGGDAAFIAEQIATRRGQLVEGSKGMRAIMS